jgi:hypothetical protein
MLQCVSVETAKKTFVSFVVMTNDGVYSKLLPHHHSGRTTNDTTVHIPCLDPCFEGFRSRSRRNGGFRIFERVTI